MILMFAGLALIFAPLGTIADVVPFLGSLLRAGTGLVAGVIALTLSILTVALAWIAYRPLVGIGLLAVVVVLICSAGRLRRKGAKATAAAAG